MTYTNTHEITMKAPLSAGVDIYPLSESDGITKSIVMYAKGPSKLACIHALETTISALHDALELEKK